MVDADLVVQARIVRSEIKTAGQGLHYELAIAFDETQHLFDSNDVANSYVLATGLARGGNEVSPQESMAIALD